MSMKIFSIQCLTCSPALFGLGRARNMGGARGTAWLYVSCLVGIRLIERSLLLVKQGEAAPSTVTKQRQVCSDARTMTPVRLI
jgi:hypothetical protein